MFRIILICSLCLSKYALASDIEIKMPANGTQISNSVVHYGQIQLDANSTIKISIEDFTADYFGILQVHAHMHNVSLIALQAPFGQEFGTNLGFTLYKGGDFELSNWKKFGEIDVAVAVIVYNRTTTPIPGACGGSPMLHLTNLAEVSLVSTDLAAKKPTECGNYTYEFRYRHMCIGDMSARTYFEGIRQMLDLNGVKKFGLTNGLAHGMDSYYVKIKRTLFIMQTVVDDKAVYIPVATYSCNPGAWNNICWGYDTMRLMYYIYLLLCSAIFLVRPLCAPGISETFMVALDAVIKASIVMQLWLPHYKLTGMVVAAIISVTFFSYFPEVRKTSSRCMAGFWIVFLCLTAAVHALNENNKMFFNVQWTTIGWILLILCFGMVILNGSCLRDTVLYMFLSYLLMFFSFSYIFGGQAYTAIDNILFFEVSDAYKYGVRTFLVAYQDGLILFSILVLGVVIMVLYKRYGELYLDMEQEYHDYKMRHPEECSILERIQIAQENVPLITRYTKSEEDEVFESPNTSHRAYSSLKHSNNHSFML